MLCVRASTEERVKQWASTVAQVGGGGVNTQKVQSRVRWLNNKIEKWRKEAGASKDERGNY